MKSKTTKTNRPTYHVQTEIEGSILFRLSTHICTHTHTHTHAFTHRRTYIHTHTHLDSMSPNKFRLLHQLVTHALFWPLLLPRSKSLRKFLRHPYPTPRRFPHISYNCFRSPNMAENSDPVCRPGERKASGSEKASLAPLHKELWKRRA